MTRPTAEALRRRLVGGGYTGLNAKALRALANEAIAALAEAESDVEKWQRSERVACGELARALEVVRQIATAARTEVSTLTLEGVRDAVVAKLAIPPHLFAACRHCGKKPLSNT